MLATDLSSRGDRALDRAMQLVRAWQSELHVVHALNVPPPAVPVGVDEGLFLEPYPDLRREALQRIDKLLPRDAPHACVHIEQGVAASAILDVAHREACDLVILGESRDGLPNLIESTLERVVRKSPASVLVVRNRPQETYRSLLVGTDFTNESQQALEVAARLFPAARIVLMHAYQMPYASLLEDPASAHAWSDDHLAKVRAQLQATDLPPQRKERVRTLVSVGVPAAALQEYVNGNDIDLTVIGAHPRGLLFDAMVGVSRPILGGIPGDILVVRAIRRGDA